MYKKLLSIGLATSILLAGCGSDNNSEVKESNMEKKAEQTMSVEKAAVELSYKIEDNKLQYPEDHDDLLEYKESVAELRPYVDALKEPKPNNETEKEFVDTASLITRDGFMDSLEEFVDKAENDSTKNVIEYFENHEVDESHNVKDVLWNTVEATEYTFGDIKQ